MSARVLPMVIAAAVLLVGGRALSAEPEGEATTAVAGRAETGHAPQAADPASVGVTVTVVLARAGTGAVEVAPELAALGPALTRAFPDHRRFTRLGRHALVVTASGASPVTLPNGSALALRHAGLREGRHALNVEVGGLRTTVQAAPGSTFFQAGRGHDGGMLVLAFEVAR